MNQVLLKVIGVKLGLGGGTKTLLWGSMPFSYPATQQTDVLLSADIKEFDEIVVYGGWISGNVYDFAEQKFDASVLDSLSTASGDLDKQFVMQMNAGAAQFIRVSKGSADNIIHFIYSGDIGIYAIVGVKHGGGSSASAVSELTDVSLNNLSNNQILKYNSTLNKWENANGSGGSSITPNPSSDATSTLEKIDIDGTVYDLKDIDAVHLEDVGAIYEWTRPTAQNSIVTDIVPNITDRIEMQYIYDEINGSWGNNNPCMFYAAPKYYYQYYGTRGYELSVGNLVNWAIWGENMIKTPGHIVTLKYNEDFTSHNVYIYDETAQTEMKSQQAMNYSEVCTGTLVFFNESSSGSRTMYSKLKYFKIWDATTQELKHHFVPVAEGLYDIVTDITYPYTNSNAYEYGNAIDFKDITHVKANPIGTPTSVLNSIKIDNTIYSVGGGPSILYGTTDPTSAQGSNGDLYFKYENVNNKVIAIYCKINNIWMDYAPPVTTIISTLPSQNETNGLQEEVEVVTS
jgi:hypothetical protein